MSYQRKQNDRKKGSRRSVMAHNLEDPLYRKRVVESKRKKTATKRYSNSKLLKMVDEDDDDLYD